MLNDKLRRSDALRCPFQVAGQRAAIAARRVEAYSLEPEAADDQNLFSSLIRKVAEGKRMPEPLQIEVDIKPDPQLIHTDEWLVRVVHGQLPYHGSG